MDYLTARDMKKENNLQLKKIRENIIEIEINIGHIMTELCSLVDRVSKLETIKATKPKATTKKATVTANKST